MFADLTVELPMSDYGTSFWHISDLVIYDKSREINEFVSASTLNTNCFGRHLKRLDRPPQSWCYVETLLEKDGDNCD